MLSWRRRASLIGTPLVFLVFGAETECFSPVQNANPFYQGYPCPFYRYTVRRPQAGFSASYSNLTGRGLWLIGSTHGASYLHPRNRCLVRRRGRNGGDADGENTDDFKSASLLLVAPSERAVGILVLLTVPLSWGTYVPVVRYLYEIQPPVPGFVFSAAYYTVASLTLLGLMGLTKGDLQKQAMDDIPESNHGEPISNNIPLQGGIELGTYLFLGNGLQVLGLKTVPADRAGFLVQLTTVMVPLVQAALAGDLRAVPTLTWLACALAFSGVVAMGLDGKAACGGDIMTILQSLSNSFTIGDGLIMMAAFVYTLHVVRLGRYATETTPLTLAAYKATAEAVLSAALVAGLWYLSDGVDRPGLLSFAQQSGQEIASFMSAMMEGIPSGAVPLSALVPAIGATLWTGWVTCAYTIYAQSFGQRRVDPTDANLIYTIQPIFTALFAYFLLGETLGPAGFVGGSLIGVAVYLIAASEQGGNDDNAAPASVETKLSGTLAVTSQPTAEIEGDSIPSS